MCIATAHTGSGAKGTDPNGPDMHGPTYIWRNIMYDATNCATKLLGTGPVYFYHNTILSIPGLIKGVRTGIARVGKAENFKGKNNIIQCSDPVNSRILGSPGTFFLDYNLYSKEPGLPSAWGIHKIVGTPRYKKIGEYSYYLDNGSFGKDKACGIPNFNDNFDGAGPDMGACELGSYILRVGPQAHFTSPDSLAAIEGKAFGYRVTYANPKGKPASLKFIKKPSWVRVLEDSISGMAPNKPGAIDTVRVVLSSQGFADTLTLRLFIFKPSDISLLPIYFRGTAFGLSANIVSKENVDFVVLLEKEGGYILEVYDIVGRKVWEYMEQAAHAGLHHIRWNIAIPDTQVRNGMYFLVLAQNQRYIARRFLVVW